MITGKCWVVQEGQSADSTAWQGSTLAVSEDTLEDNDRSGTRALAKKYFDLYCSNRAEALIAVRKTGDTGITWMWTITGRVVL